MFCTEWVRYSRSRLLRDVNDLVAVDHHLLKIIKPRAEVAVVQREISGGQPRYLRLITCRLQAQEQMAVEIQVVEGMPDTGDGNHAFQSLSFECVSDLTY